MKKLIIPLIFLVIGSSILGQPFTKRNPSIYQLTWNTPGETSLNSMPLGNGDVGLNVWVEKDGDLLFYISKVNGYDAGHMLPKLGRIRIHMQPAMAVSDFKQTLNLMDASIQIKAGDMKLKVWVDANQPIICVEAKTKTARTAIVSLETLRPLYNATDSIPQKGTAGILFNDKANRVAWCYRNQTSAWAENLKKQNAAALVQQAKDPILHRTSGCWIEGKHLVRLNDRSLISKTISTQFDCSISVLSSQPAHVQNWLADLSTIGKPDWESHCAYWNKFWNRSFIEVTSSDTGLFHLDQCKYNQFSQGANAYRTINTIDLQKNLAQINQRYALERFCQAIANRGEVPTQYNGSIFTMDMPIGAKKFKGTLTAPRNADERDWSVLSFMWQNTRHPLWSMFGRGDYDCIKPSLNFIKDGLEIAKDRCLKTFGHEGAFIMEASWWYNVGVWDWTKVPPHLKYHLLATVETVALMCDYYEYTQDKEFLNYTLLPCAEAFLKFYELHYPARDAHGKMVMNQVGCVETYQGVTNPCTEMGCMKYVLSKLIRFPADETKRAYWLSLQKLMPEIPTRMVRGVELLAVGEKYDPGREICESPELYSVYPFRQSWLSNHYKLAEARQSFHVRTTSLDGTADGQAVETGGWQATPVQAAYLGLAREAERLTSINFNDQFIDWHDNIGSNVVYKERPRARFPAFWETKMDGTPDNDHGANSVNALQSMLLQTDGDKIYLLPAWPENRDVHFTLAAAKNTTVECEYRNGKVVKLLVSPASRRKDLINMSSFRNRIRTLVEVALADYNYLFGLPPMLDAQPIAGKTTANWISKFGYTLQGCKAGPWKNSVFKGNTVYVHTLDWPHEGVKLSAIPRELKNYQSLTGNIKVTKTADGWLLTGTPDTLNTIVKLEFDHSVEDIAMSLPSKGSFTLGQKKNTWKDAQGKTNMEVKFDSPKQISRFECMIANPDHLRGKGLDYDLQVQQVDGNWKTLYQGKIYGTICSKQIEKTEATAVRLVVEAQDVKLFDVF